MHPETGALVLKKVHGKKADQRICKKRLFKCKNLCYSIGEADRVLNAQISRRASTWANGRDISANNSFHIGWRHITKEELPANMDSGSKVCPIGIFIVGFMEDYGRGNQFSEVVHDKPGKDFLVNVLHFFCVKMQQANCVFEFPERGFNTPAHGIEFFEFIGREIRGIQIGYNGFVGIISDFESYDSEGEFVKNRWVMLTILLGKEVKTCCGRDPAILVFVLAKFFHFIRTFCSQR